MAKSKKRMRRNKNDKKLRSNTVRVIQQRIALIEQQIKAVNEKWHQKAIELARDFVKHDEAAHDRKTQQLSKRQAFDKAAKSVEAPYKAFIKQADNKTRMALRNACVAVYDTEGIGNAIERRTLNINTSCGSCNMKVQKAAEAILADNSEKQVQHIKNLMTMLTDLRADLAEQTGETEEPKESEDVEKPKRKRGRPKKTENMAQASGQNEPEDK